MKTNRKSIAEEIKAHKGFSYSESMRLTNSFFDIIVTSLKNGNEVKLTGFGVFKIKTRKEKKGRNPSTGAEIILPVHKTISFTASKKLKELINIQG
jgi:nucleoid DNA-binding protein